MGALDSSRLGTNKPFDAFLTRKLINRDVDVITQRLSVLATSWTPTDSGWFDATSDDLTCIKLTGENYRYGVKLTVDAEPEARYVDVAGILNPLYEDVHLRFYALGEDGRWRYLPLEGTPAGTFNQTDLTAGSGRAVYTWRLDVSRLQGLRSSQFELVMAMDSDLGADSIYRIWRNANRSTNGTPSDSFFGVVKDDTYPVTPVPSANFIDFWNTWGNRPVKINFEVRVDKLAGGTWAPFQRAYDKFDIEGVYLGSVCKGDNTPANLDEVTPDILWLEPWWLARPMLEDGAWVPMDATTPHEYNANFRVKVQSMGELEIEAMSAACVSGTETNAVTNDLQFLEFFADSQVPYRNITRVRAALGVGRSPRAMMVNRIITGTQDYLWSTRTPYFDWGTQELAQEIRSVSSNAKQELFRSDLARAVHAVDQFARQGVAGTFSRKWATVRFVWSWFFYNAVETFLADIVFDYYDVSGTLIHTDTFAGSIEAGTDVNYHIDVGGARGDGLVRGGAGFWFRAHHLNAGRHRNRDDTSLAKNWPSGDWPNRFRGTTRLRAFQLSPKEMFQVDVEIPSGCSYVVVSVQPNVASTFFDPAERQNNIFVVHHHDIRMTRAAAWSALGV